MNRPVMAKPLYLEAVDADKHDNARSRALTDDPDMTQTLDDLVRAVF